MARAPCPRVDVAVWNTRGHGAQARAFAHATHDPSMTLDALLFQSLNGLASASGLFFVGAGLSLIFGVTRIINIAHGSFYMLGLYLAASFATKVGGALGFWGGIVAAGLVVAALGALIEMLLLRRIYQAPELFQLLATFALVLIINDATQYVWG